MIRRGNTRPNSDLGVSIAARPHDWRADAVCRREQADPELFSPREDYERGVPDRVFVAASYCFRCPAPVRAACRAEGERRGDQGVRDGHFYAGNATGARYVIDLATGTRAAGRHQ